MKVALDTNVLAYAEGVNGAEKRDIVLELLRNIPQETTVVPVQVLGELFDVLVRKASRSAGDARQALLSWRDAFPTAGTTPEAMTMALDLAADHRFGIRDAIILSTASQSGCRLLLSENLQHGFTWAGVTVVNPFALPRHELLDALLGSE